MTCDPGASVVPLLDRYLDGELPEAARLDLEAHLRGCASCAVEALRRRELQAAVREAGRAFEPDAALAARLTARLRAGSGLPAQRAALPWRLPLAAALLLGVALASLWVGTRAAGRGRVVTEIVDLHVSALGEAVGLDVLSSDAHTVKPWFEGRLPFAFDLPDLSGTAWELAGARLVRVDAEPAAQLVFGIRRHRVSVLVFRDTGGPGGALSAPVDRETSRGFRIASWTANGLRHVAVSDTGAEDLRTLVDRFVAAAR